MENGKNEVSGIMRLLGVLASVLMIVIGIYLFFNMRYIVLMFSAAVLIQGIMLIGGYLFTKGPRNGWDIILGAINILFGVVMVFGGTATRVAGVFTIEMFVSFWILFAGFSYVFGSFKLKNLGVKKWIWTLIGGILMIICGVMFVSMPLMGSFVMVELLGIYVSISFIISGLTGVAASLSTKGEEKTGE